MVVVEVRQGTLSMDGRGWGPTENTVDRGSHLDEEDEEDEDDKDDEEDEEDEEEEEDEEDEDEDARKRKRKRKRKATNIKSNNPHLAGGEKRNEASESASFGLFKYTKHPVLGLHQTMCKIEAASLRSASCGILWYFSMFALTVAKRPGVSICVLQPSKITKNWCQSMCIYNIITLGITCNYH